jgi:hypothetical protein
MPTSQSSRTSNKKRLGESQRLRSGWSNKPTSQSGAGGGSWTWSCGTEGSIQNWIAPPCWANRVVAIEQCSCCLVKTKTALTTLHELAVSHLSYQLQFALWMEGIKHYLQASHLMRPHQSFCLHANTRIGCQRNNSRTFTKQTELLVVMVPGFFLYY